MKQILERNQGWSRWLRGIALGAAAMYIFDPDKGRRRRALLQDKLRHVTAKTSDAIDVAMRDLGNRLVGIQARLSRSLVRREEAPVDQVLTARVRTLLGRVVSHPHAVEVAARHGCLILSGPILAHEQSKLLELVRAVPGVAEVEDKLVPHERPEGVSILQEGTERKQIRPEFMQENWTPALRTIAALGGGALGWYGLTRRRTPTDMALAAAGFALLARAVSNMPLKHFVGIGTADRPIELQKTIEINAAPEIVFDLWAKYENFPYFMSHVLEVRDLGQQRSHWIVKGPAGTRLEWDASVTACTRPSVLAWKSEPGAAVEHSGSIRFEPTDSGTRAVVHLHYRPPAGALGHGVAVLLGSDPKHELNDDLMRMKTFIERGIRPHDAAKPAAASNQMLH